MVRGVSRWWGQAVLSCMLRFAAKCLYELCPQVFYARRNRRNSPSMARFLLASASMPRHFCTSQHNSTVTKQLRYSPARQYRLSPPPASATYAETLMCRSSPAVRSARRSQPSCGKLSAHIASHSTHYICRKVCSVF